MKIEDVRIGMKVIDDRNCRSGIVTRVSPGSCNFVYFQGETERMCVQDAENLRPSLKFKIGDKVIDIRDNNVYVVGDTPAWASDKFAYTWQNGVTIAVRLEYLKLLPAAVEAHCRKRRVLINNLYYVKDSGELFMYDGNGEYCQEWMTMAGRWDIGDLPYLERMISEGKTLELQAPPDDVLKKMEGKDIYQEVADKTGLPRSVAKSLMYAHIYSDGAGTDTAVLEYLNDTKKTGHYYCCRPVIQIGNKYYLVENDETITKVNPIEITMVTYERC